MMKQSKEPKEPKQKTRAKTRLKQKVQKNKNRVVSEDLTKLTDQYNAFCKRLEGLVTALTNQHAAMQQLAKAKFQVAQHLAVISKDTVLYETTGQTAGAERSTDSVNSYFSVQEGVTNKNAMYCGKYKEHVVDYAQQWYKVVTDRVGAGLKKADTLRVELDHYQSKVEGLRQSANSTMAKGKQVDAKSAERLTRNEDKLIKIKESSTKYVNDLCLLMEEITERSWRDLHPLLIKCSQFEVQVSGDESKDLVSLNNVVAALKKIASEHGITSQNRLKDLEKLDPHVLSTRSKDDSRNLAIENGFSGLALGGGNSVNGDAGSIYSAISGVDNSLRDSNRSYFPPGSTAAQGLGGFPVRVQSDEALDSTANSIVSSNGNGAPSTLSMMNINAAPAPTMSTMAQAYANGGHKSSFDSLQSDLSGAPAPPPSSAPPPPPPATPVDHNSTNPFGMGAPAPSQSPYGTAPSTYESTTTGAYGAPASSPMMPGGMEGNANSMYGGSTSGYPQQSPGNFTQQQSPMQGGYGYGQQQQSPAAGVYGQQQSPMVGGYGQPQQQSPMGGGFGQQQSPMGGGFGQQQTPTAANFSQQRSPMGGSFSSQQSPMGGSGNFAQQQSMYTSPPPSQQRNSAPSPYGNNPFNY